MLNTHLSNWVGEKLRMLIGFKDFFDIATRSNQHREMILFLDIDITSYPMKADLELMLAGRRGTELTSL